MRRLSFTLGWPMNSASRWGRSEYSTADSSVRTSGVVISARDIDGRRKEWFCEDGFSDPEYTRRYSENERQPGSAVHHTRAANASGKRRSFCSASSKVSSLLQKAKRTKLRPSSRFE